MLLRMQPRKVLAQVQQFCHLLGATSNFFVQIYIKINKKIDPHLKTTSSKAINCPRSKKGTLKTCQVPVAFIDRKLIEIKRSLFYKIAIFLDSSKMHQIVFG